MSNEAGKKEAFCPLLFEAGHGGRADLIDDDGNYVGQRHVRGLCTEPIDCNSCVFMQHEISYHHPDTVTWVCPTCIGPIFKWAKKNNVQIHAPGFYSEGYCEYPWCERPGDGTPEMPPKFSLMRQVVFGRIRT